MRQTEPLDPQRFQLAVTSLALYQAKTKVIEQISANGEKLSAYSSRDISVMKEAYFAQHTKELITQALEDVWRLPSFARYRQPRPFVM
jgi:hypothetical protein